SVSASALPPVSVSASALPPVSVSASALPSAPCSSILSPFPYPKRLSARLPRALGRRESMQPRLD
ncbi:MAG: hypothetical protein V5A85_09845, partial [Haloarculaceae archaeon]